MGWNNGYEIQKAVVDIVIGQKADIFVLTAFVAASGMDYLFDQLKKHDYIWFLTFETGKNGILIGIKETIIDKNKLVSDVYDKKAVYSIDNGCNILRVICSLKNGSPLTVLGCRMETGKCENQDQLKEQYNFEKKSFDDILIPTIGEAEGLYIVCGDFNNARCLGNLDNKYNEKDYDGKAQCNYNLNIIKDRFEELKFVLADVKKGAPIPTHKIFPDDHIFLRGFTVTDCNSIPVDNLSDHFIIMAKVEICEENS